MRSIGSLKKSKPTKIKHTTNQILIEILTGREYDCIKVGFIYFKAVPDAIVFCTKKHNITQSYGYISLKRQRHRN